MESFGCGDSYLIRDAWGSSDSNEEDTDFTTLLQEIEWCEMLHRGSPGKEVFVVVEVFTIDLLDHNNPSLSHLFSLKCTLSSFIFFSQYLG